MELSEKGTIQIGMAKFKLAGADHQGLWVTGINDSKGHVLRLSRALEIFKPSKRRKK